MRTVPTVIPLTIKTPEQLAAMYLPFIRNGGLFLPTPKLPKMGDEIAFLLKLPGRSQSLKVLTRVVWLNPPGGSSRVGFGVQFDEQDKGETRRAIEEILSRFSDKEVPKLCFS